MSPLHDARRGATDAGGSRLPRWHEWLYAPRVLEPEVMDETGEAEAYMDAAAHEHLAALDARWIERVLTFGPSGAARVLDVGTGGGQIPAGLAARRPQWRIWAVDRARAMLESGRATLEAAARETRRRARPFRLGLAQADGRALPFPDAAFDLVISNSLLHHLSDPAPLLDEMARVAGSAGRLLLRDLRRPPRWRFRRHLAWHGRHYHGTMRRLYEDSVAAAFTPAEVSLIALRTRLTDARVHAEGPYLTVEARGTDLAGEKQSAGEEERYPI